MTGTTVQLACPALVRILTLRLGARALERDGEFARMWRGRHGGLSPEVSDLL